MERTTRLGLRIAGRTIAATANRVGISSTTGMSASTAFFGSRLARNFNSAGRRPDDETLASQIEKNYKELYKVYDQRPSCINTYKKQLIFRSRNLGMKELDLLVGTWAAKHVPDLSYSECTRFEEEVLHMETPDLSQILTEKVNDFDHWNFPKQHFLAKIKVFSDNPNWNSPK